MQPDRYNEIRGLLNDKREMRMNVTFDVVEQRASDGVMTISGYGAVYNQKSEPLYGMFEETIAPGAFRKMLGSKCDVKYLENHGDLPLARVGNGTLRFQDDPVGVRITADLNPADPQAVSLFAKVQRGDVYQQSFQFSMVGGRDQWTYATSDDEYDQRLILEFGEVYEFSAVGSPAYTPTTLAAVGGTSAADADEDSDSGDAIATARSDAAAGESHQQDADEQERRGGDGEQPSDSGTSVTPDERDASEQAAVRIRARLAAHRTRRKSHHESRTEGRA